MGEKTLGEILAETCAEVASRNFFDGDVYCFYRNETRYLIDEKGAVPQDFWFVTLKAKRNGETTSVNLYVVGNNRVLFSSVNGKISVVESRCKIVLGKRTAKDFAQIVFRGLIGGYILSAVNMIGDLTATVDIKNGYFYGHIIDCNDQRRRNKGNPVCNFVVGDAIEWCFSNIGVRGNLKIEDADHLRLAIKHYAALQPL